MLSAILFISKHSPSARKLAKVGRAKSKKLSQAVATHLIEKLSTVPKCSRIEERNFKVFVGTTIGISGVGKFLVENMTCRG